ncbi:MAG: helix-turn-helix domain-containing protein [Solidesulfovibrio sp. DCME]|uniref:helix-turn-helix domain-containing protein n=1 Tax=Solidesulfovibrio sp. DCME TaxID=3447380 RepID=UPI003D13B05A
MRQGRKIRAWMVGEGLTNVEVASRAAARPEYVSETIHGKRHHRRVLQVLVDAGCPVRFLDLPEDMKGKEAA